MPISNCCRVPRKGQYFRYGQWYSFLQRQWKHWYHYGLYITTKTKKDMLNMLVSSFSVFNPLQGNRPRLQSVVETVCGDLWSMRQGESPGRQIVVYENTAASISNRELSTIQTVVSGVEDRLMLEQFIWFVVCWQDSLVQNNLNYIN